MMKNQKGFTATELLGFLVLMFWFVVAVSWVWNFVKLTDCDFEPGYRCEVIHGAGLLPIVSPVAVWFATDKD